MVNIPPHHLETLLKGGFAFVSVKMSLKTPSTTSKQPEVIVQEESSDPPPQGPSNLVRMISKKGKVIMVKREGDQEIEYEQELEKLDLHDFKLRPIEKFKEASQ